MDAVASSFRPDVVNGVAGTRRDTLDDVGVPGDAETKDVHERIAGVRRLERNLAAYGRNADAVAVAGDTGDDAFEQTACAAVVDRSKSQRVEERDGTRAHREDIADDSADACGGALVRLYERRMVVRFDLEHRRESVADVDRARVLSRALQHLGPLGRQRLEMDARALVTAVLRPHHGEDTEFGQVRLAAEKRHDTVVFVGLDPVPFENLGIHHRIARLSAERTAMRTDWRITRPSSPPSNASHARSGCGIRPSTF